MADKTSYAQSLTHLIKGNLGAGILAMPASFAHLGLVGATLGLPFLCLICAYAVCTLVKSSQSIESKSKGLQVNYSNLAKQAFELGPEGTRVLSDLMSCLVDGALLVTQVGVCCVYIVFVVDNMTSILASYDIIISKSLAFLAIFPVTLLLSMIRTLNRLAFASLVANLLQAVGLALIVEYLVRDLNKVNLKERDNFRPLNEMALGFGSAMFAFEGISVVLPLYSQMKSPKQMLGCCGVVNVSFVAILVLYTMMGLLGYLKYGHHVEGSITLNLPAEPVYDGVRAMFLMSILLSYPLQFYTPFEIVWEWSKRNFFGPTKRELSIIRAIEVVIPPGTKITETLDGVKQVQPSTTSESNLDHGSDQKRSPLSINTTITTTATNGTGTINTTTNTQIDPYSSRTMGENVPVRYEYYCRVLLVLVTFVLAFTVPKLNLLMDLIGSLTGALLSLTLPCMIHLATFWTTSRGLGKATMIVVDSVIILISLVASIGGGISSVSAIVDSFR